MTNNPIIERTETVYQGWCRLDRISITAQARDGRLLKLVREVHDHGSGVAVLPYDLDRKTALVVRQLRAPVLINDGVGLIVEVPAGLVDPDDPDPETALRREASEELGYRLGDLEQVGHVYSSPGSLSERLALYLARYTPADRIGSGGGVETEGEDIEVLEMPLAQLSDNADNGAIQDMKTLLLIQTLRLRGPELFR